MTRGSEVFFWVETLHALYFFGSKDLSRIFLGLISERTFRFGFLLRSVDQKNINSNFIQRRVFLYICNLVFRVQNFNARYFFGSKISGLCIFGGLQFEAPSNPPSCILRVPPPPPPPIPLGLDNDELMITITKFDNKIQKK